MPVQPTANATADALHREVIEKLISTQRCLQKWHAAVQQSAGSPAFSPLRGQGRALSLLARKTEMRQRDMCEQLGIRPQSLGEMLFKLEKNGLIERRALDTGNHALSVRITDKGLALATDTAVVPNFDSFTDDELRSYITFLDRTMVELNRHRELLTKTDAAE